MDPSVRQEPRRPARIRLIAAVAAVVVLAGCSASAPSAVWTFAPDAGSAGPVTSSPASSAAPSSAASAPEAAASAPPAGPTPAVSSSPTAVGDASPVTAASPAASASGSGSAAGGTAPAFRGKMDPHVLLVDGYITMYMTLANTGTEPLTFINTLYDTEPTKLYAPTVAFPWESGDTALVTRQGRFFPSPAIVQPGATAVYVMGGQQARGTGVLAGPVANIKFCPTRGMDDKPSVPVQVRDLAWSSAGGLTTVTGTLLETEGSQRPDPPVVGVVFFDQAGGFVGAVVDSRVGDRLGPHASVPFTISGRGVDDARIDHLAAYAFVS